MTAGRRTLGLDAGGTGTRMVLVVDGRVADERSGPPMNVLLHHDAVERLTATIVESGADAVGLGLAGVRSPQQARDIEDTLRARTGVDVVVGDDAEVALLGAFEGGPGIIVISGTGSGAFGRDAAGRTERVGGHGYLLGDEGSGYWIGRAAVSAALRSADGTGPAAPALEELLAVAFGGDLSAVEQRVYGAPTDRRVLARLVPLLDSMRDPVVDEILATAAAHLAEQAMALRARLGDLPVAMGGGVFRCAAIRDAFTDATGAVRPLHTPEYGAVLLASRPRQRDLGWAERSVGAV